MRTIEVFTAGCPLCNDTLELVRAAVKGCGCEVVERRCTGTECCTEAKDLGVKAVPTIVVDGVIAFEGRPSREWAETMLRRQTG
ncbi:MAG: thioredoxin family protein [Thermodesulfobacteriota bacterium]